MTEFDSEKFEDKYASYFPELQRVYEGAFETTNDEFGSSLIHRVDQRILNKSESFYDDGDFSVRLPDDPTERLMVAGIDDDELDAVLDRCIDEIEGELRRAFGVEA